MNKLSELASRILAHLEEAHAENVSSTINTVASVSGDIAEVSHARSALTELTNLDYVRIAYEVNLNGKRLAPVSKEQSLADLLRGQFGTECAMPDRLTAGAQFVLLDAAVARVPLLESEQNLTLNWRYGPGNRDIGDASYVTAPFAFRALGLRPLSPARVRATRSSGNVSLSWLRRTRSGGDNWELPDVPLGEESETYEVDILDGATVKRTLRSSSPNAVYSSADQIADFGAPQPSISVMVYQTNVVFGRGTARPAVI